MFSIHKNTGAKPVSEHKKSVSLFQYLKNSSIKKNHQTNNTSFIDSTQLDFGEINAQTQKSHHKKRSQRLSITPKKVKFQDDVDQHERKTGTSFIQMISPIKKRYSVQYNSQQLIDTQPPASNNLSTKAFSRKKMNDSLQGLKNIVVKLVDQGETVKKKAHTLAIEIRPLLKFVEEGLNDNMAQRAFQIRQKIRLFEHGLKDIERESVNNKFQAFQQNISEHLLSTESQLRAEYQQNETNNTIKMKEKNDRQTQELLEEREKLLRTIDILERKYDKLEKNTNTDQEKLKQKADDDRQKYINLITRLQQDNQQLIDENNKISEQLSKIQEQSSQLSKKLKDAVYYKEQVEEKMMEANLKVKSAKEQFLLREITALKEQFSRDIKQLNILNQRKEEEKNMIITQLKQELKGVTELAEAFRNRQQQINSQNQQLRQAINKYKNQNQCLVTDIHRMNEEFYHHWIALKDIKILAKRLSLMDKFHRIYEDLAFNDQLFL